MSKLLWLDLEMTGLDPDIDTITEVAAIVTDYDFKELARYEAVIKFDQAAIDRMKSSQWYEEEEGQRVYKGTVYDMATASGLVERNQSKGRAEPDVLAEFKQFIESNFDDPAVLAGNSIHQDRRFIRRYWQSIEDLLHYRMLDVTSFKLIALNKFGLEYQSAKTHAALDDIEDSINELKFYLDKLSS